jgi:hypothetical protein
LREGSKLWSSNDQISERKAFLTPFCYPENSVSINRF